ncbi:nucleotide exchange factor GrpE [Epidermidibacterium keratini]|uniref:Nucleotide exchange factor GrpE n=1 Tax=Epidermidibacterium keratini TaxID=1891644 RepID=A0A7L4YMF8_9ACTN|nr:nucleotide exchange factor GrpE [Epidermidibacterium keratini]QHC00242.1 nucleotide exchange factor GrpE [Epidermidibacterium keratini]
MTDQQQPNDTAAADPEADAALDHALRARPVDAEAEDEYDDASYSQTDEQPVLTGEATQQPSDIAATDGTGEGEVVSDDAEDYVLYSEVRPHLEELVVLQDQRGKMIDILLYARDRVSSPAVASRMDDNLAQLGIQVIVPSVGELFDPARHEASATVQTDDAAAHGTIAEVELAGYTDGDRMVRVPIVTVYSAEQETA